MPSPKDEAYLQRSGGTGRVECRVSSPTDSAILTPPSSGRVARSSIISSLSLSLSSVSAPVQTLHAQLLLRPIVLPSIAMDSALGVPGAHAPGCVCVFRTHVLVWRLRVCAVCSPVRLHKPRLWFRGRLPWLLQGERREGGRGVSAALTPGGGGGGGGGHSCSAAQTLGAQRAGFFWSKGGNRV